MSAINGNTSYALAAEWRLELGNHADGRALWIANVDATPNQVDVEISGANEGVRVYSLPGKGDSIVIPAGDVTIVTIRASAYPTTIGWGFLIPGMALGSGLRR